MSAWAAYQLWSPGEQVTDGRHDRGENGIWIQHGWLGADEWFDRYDKDRTRFRSKEKLQELADLLRKNHVAHIYPHLCPTTDGGEISPVDDQQTSLFLDVLDDFEVYPWIGGVYERDVELDSPAWRQTFVGSIAGLLERHPRFAGVHLNIEPLPSGTPEYLGLLDEIRGALPSGKRLSIAAYPPPTIWHRFPEVHWEEEYFRQVAERADQIVPMMYDTALRKPKLYQRLMADWTEEVLAWSGDTEVLLGLPAYEDADVGYHDPETENLPNALWGIHAGLLRHHALPTNYRGVSIYCGWEMTEEKWRTFGNEFSKRD